MQLGGGVGNFFDRVLYGYYLTYESQAFYLSSPMTSASNNILFNIGNVSRFNRLFHSQMLFSAQRSVPTGADNAPYNYNVKLYIKV